MTEKSNRGWYKTQISGRWQARDLGWVQTIVVDRQLPTGRGKTKWLAFMDYGQRVAGTFDSRQQAMAAVEAVAAEIAKAAANA